MQFKENESLFEKRLDVINQLTLMPIFSTKLLPYKPFCLNTFKTLENIKFLSQSRKERGCRTPYDEDTIFLHIPIQLTILNFSTLI